MPTTRYPDYLVWVDGSFAPAACLAEFEEDAIAEGIEHCLCMDAGGTLTDANGTIIGVFIAHYNFPHYMGFIPRRMAS